MSAEVLQAKANAAEHWHSKETVFDDECEECDDDDQRKFNKRICALRSGRLRCATFDQPTVMESSDWLSLTTISSRSRTTSQSSTITASTRSKFLERWQTC